MKCGPEKDSHVFFLRSFSSGKTGNLVSTESSHYIKGFGTLGSFQLMLVSSSRTKRKLFHFLLPGEIISTSRMYP